MSLIVLLSLSEVLQMSTRIFQFLQKNVIIDTVKPAEDGSGDIIVRLYEAKSTYTSCNLNVGIDVNEAYFTDMLENNITKAEMQDNHILLNIKAFEIITLRLKTHLKIVVLKSKSLMRELKKYGKQNI